MPTALVRLGIMVFQLLLLLLPAAAVASWGVRRQWSLPAVFTLGACATAAAGYLALWVYIASPAAGAVFSWLLFGGSVACVLRFRRSIPDFRVPIGVCLSAAILYYSLGFLYGGIEDPMGAAARRYFHWAIDNQLPFIYASRILGSPMEMPSPWTVYDRPPLAAGVLLLTAPFGVFPARYQTLGMLMQAFVLSAAWVFLEATDVPERMRRVAVGTCVFSVFVLVNAFYVWPKLLPAAFLFLALALVYRREAPWLAGAAMGFAMLCHGGSLFPVLVLCAALPFWMGWAAWRPVAAAAAVYLPWALYAAVMSPAGPNLAYWHLGGILPHGVLPGESTLDVICRGYASLSPGAILSNKWENLRFQFFPLGIPWNRKGVVDGIFSCTILVVAVPLAASVVCLAAGVRTGTWKARVALAPALLGLAATLLWCLVMFGPHMAVTDAASSNATATLPQGSYWPPLCLLIALALLVCRYGRWPARGMLAVQFALFCFLGFQAPYTGEAHRLDMVMGACAVLSAAALLVWTYRST